MTVFQQIPTEWTFSSHLSHSDALILFSVSVKADLTSLTSKNVYSKWDGRTSGIISVFLESSLCLQKEGEQAARCLRCTCGRMCSWVSSSALSLAGCATGDGSHSRGTGWSVGGMCHPHHSQVVSAVEALDFTGLWCCCSAGRGYICLKILCLKRRVVRCEDYGCTTARRKSLHLRKQS